MYHETVKRQGRLLINDWEAYVFFETNRWSSWPSCTARPTHNNPASRCPADMTAVYSIHLTHMVGVLQ